MGKKGFLTASVFALSLCLGGQLWAEEAQPARSKTHLMWHMTPVEGASPEMATTVEKGLRSFFSKTHGQSLMDGLTMDSLLLVEGNEKFLRCGVGAGCIAGLGDLAGMRWVIAGEVGLRSGRTFVRMVLVDTSNRTIVSRASCESSGQPSPDAMAELAVAMFEPQKYRGSIELAVPVDGANVLLDGNRMGLTPLPGPLTDIPAGEHLLEVRKAGRQPFSRTVKVPMGKAVRVVALLPEAAYIANKGPRPFYKNWPFWTATGVGVVAAVSAGVLHADAIVNQDNADVCRRDGADCDKKYQDKADSLYLQAYVVYGLAGAGLLAAGLIAILDSTLEPAGGDADKPAMNVGPALLRGGAGIQANWRF